MSHRLAEILELVVLNGIPKEGVARIADGCILGQEHEVVFCIVVPVFSVHVVDGILDNGRCHEESDLCFSIVPKCICGQDKVRIHQNDLILEIGHVVLGIVIAFVARKRIAVVDDNPALKVFRVVFYSIICEPWRCQGNILVAQDHMVPKVDDFGIPIECESV